jgi:hypothetical protein
MRICLEPVVSKRESQKLTQPKTMMEKIMARATKTLSPFSMPSGSSLTPTNKARQRDQSRAIRACGFAALRNRETNKLKQPNTMVARVTARATPKLRSKAMDQFWHVPSFGT